MLLTNIPKFFYDTPDDAGGAGTLTKDGIMDALNDDSADKDDIIDLNDKPDKNKDDKSKDKDENPKKEEKVDDDDENDEDDEDDDDVDDLSELEEDLKEPTEEDLDIVTPVRRAEILKKYPTLFKDFPYLEKAYYREQQFTELYPTINDARLANEKAETLDKFEADLMKGNPEFVLTAVKQEDSKAFNKLIDNYLPALAKIDNNAYTHVVGNVIKYTIVGMVNEAKRSNNDTLRNAALILNQFAFASSEFTPAGNLDDGKDDNKDNTEANKLQNERMQFKKEKFETANNDLNGRVNNSFRATIESNIDPKKSMTDYVRRNAVREASEMLAEYIQKDTRFTKIIDQLWERADKSNYSKDSIDNIRSAFLTKAKTLLPSVIKKARNDALKGMGKRVKNDDNNDKDDNDTKSDDRSTKNRSKTSDKPQSRNNKSGQVPSGMSSLDFLMSDD